MTSRTAHIWWVKQQNGLHDTFLYRRMWHCSLCSCRSIQRSCHVLCAKGLAKTHSMQGKAVIRWVMIATWLVSSTSSPQLSPFWDTIAEVPPSYFLYNELMSPILPNFLKRPLSVIYIQSRGSHLHILGCLSLPPNWLALLFQALQTFPWTWQPHILSTHCWKPHGLSTLQTDFAIVQIYSKMFGKTSLTINQPRKSSLGVYPAYWNNSEASTISEYCIRKWPATDRRVLTTLHI